MPAPLISFVVPCRNEESEIDTAIAHIERMAKPYPHEIVLVDDASDRPLSESVHSDVLPLVRCERLETRAGVAKARRMGSEIAKGEILFHLDAHVCLSAGAIEKLLEASERHPGSILGASLCHTESRELFEACAAGDWRADRLPLSSGWKVDLTPLPWIVPRPRATSEIEPAPIAGAAALWIPSATYRELGGFFPGLIGYGNVEDTELCLSAWALGFEVRILRDVTCLHYAKPEGEKRRNVVAPGHEHPRYEGNALNAARVAWLHLPVETFLGAGYRTEDIARIPCPELTARTRHLETKRRRSRETLLSIAVDAPHETDNRITVQRMLVCDSRSRLEGLDPSAFERIACLSRTLLEAIERAGHTGASMLAATRRTRLTLDDLYAYYRPELWARGFREEDFEKLDGLAANGRLYLENAVLERMAPYWYREDCLGGLLSRVKARKIRLAIDDPLLESQLRGWATIRGSLYGTELEAP